jgi:predicted dehydrogenase
MSREVASMRPDAVPEIGVGLLGPAGIGQAHAHAYCLIPRVLWPPVARPRLVRVCGRQMAKAEATRARYGFERAGDRWPDLVSDPAVQVLDDCAPNHLHLEPCLAAIRAGKHVFCEKPLGRSATEARVLRDAAAQGGIVHMVGFNYRFLPAVALASRLIDEGRLGRIHHFRAHFADASLLDPDAPFTWHQDAEAAGSNALLDLGSHLIDLARFLVGEPTAVSGAVATFVADRLDPATGRRRRVETEDAFEATVEFANGALGNLAGTNMAAGRRAHMTFELNGSGGTIVFDLERLNSLWVSFPGESPTGGGLREIHVTDADHPYGGRWWPPGHSIGWDASLVHELAHFLGAVAGHRSAGPLGATFEDGYRCAVVCDAILEAARAGRRVAVEA